MGPTIITCAVTGSDDTTGKSSAVPVTPEEIAVSALEAHAAGAAVAHLHVRDPDTGRMSTSLDLYVEVVDRIRQAGSDVLINLTTGPGQRVRVCDDTPWTFDNATRLRSLDERLAHIVACRPDLCSLNIGSFNRIGDMVVNAPQMLRAMADRIASAGVKPELEVFDLGHIVNVADLIGQGAIEPPAFVQCVLGMKYGAPATSRTLQAAVDLIPDGTVWSAFGIGAREFPVIAQAILLGGHVRVGLEDNLYIRRGILANSNAELVDRAVTLVDLLGGSVATPADARTILGLGEVRSAVEHGGQER